MNHPVADSLLHAALPFADYRHHQQTRLDSAAEARAQQAGARVGISQAHESAALHVTGSAAYIDDLPELAGTLHCALGLSPVAAGRLLEMALDAAQAMPGVVRVLTAADIPGVNDCGSAVKDEPICVMTPSTKGANCGFGRLGLTVCGFSPGARPTTAPWPRPISPPSGTATASPANTGAASPLGVSMNTVR